uniref:Nodule-specific cysteine-rich peptide G42 n=1 Tax=Pisum sativum TaxID=3888 RepID=A0A7T8DV55_PEA|nr:nodule-specific cysteine-rich peptide G42 [Pisum sativum]
MSGVLKFVCALIIILSLVVIVTSDKKLFCYKLEDCDPNFKCREGYVMKCHIFRCNCMPKEE